MVLLAVFFPACQDQGVEPATGGSDWLPVALKNTETFEYPMVGGDEEGARIIQQASHYRVSEVRRDATTNFIAVYYYQPEGGYEGRDYVRIEVRSSFNGIGPPSRIDTVAFVFVVRK